LDAICIDIETPMDQYHSITNDTYM